jgi:O-antigen/teichoic acid export membrane protein
MHLWWAHLSLPMAHAYLLERSRMMLSAAVVGLAAYVGSAWLLEPTWHAMGVAQAGAIGTAAATMTLLWLVSRKTDLRTWFARRDLPLMVSPVLLAAPSIWPAGGDWVLAALAGLILVVTACTNLLWSREDREMFRSYVVYSVRLVLGRQRSRE